MLLSVTGTFRNWQGIAYFYRSENKTCCFNYLSILLIKYNMKFIDLYSIAKELKLR